MPVHYGVLARLTDHDGRDARTTHHHAHATRYFVAVNGLELGTRYVEIRRGDRIQLSAGDSRVFRGRIEHSQMRWLLLTDELACVPLEKLIGCTAILTRRYERPEEEVESTESTTLRAGATAAAASGD